MQKTFTQKLKFVFLTLILLVVGLLNSYGQDFQSGVMQGKIRIKIKPGTASEMAITRSAKGSVSTGIQQIDKLNKAYAVTGMTRVFPYSPQFEGKHMKHGLHLWYEITMNSKAPSMEAVQAYGNLSEIEVAEPILEAVINDGSGKPTYVPQPVSRSANAYFNDPYLVKQWHYNNTGQTGGTPGADINLYNAWGITKGRPNVTVSIHDQGVDYKHEDLKEMMWVNEAEKNGTTGVDDDGNGYKDDINGFNFSNNSGTVDIQYHGTHVAGTVAAKNNNGIGVCGVAGGSGIGDGARVMTCQILGGSHAANIPESYVYAADNGAVISQNSWGYASPGVYEQSVHDAIDYFIAEAGDYPGSPMKGGVVFFASGNSGTEKMMYPAAYPSVVSVSSLDALNTKPEYSNYGTWVNISAPGGDSDDNVTIGAGNYQNGIMSTLDKNGYGYLDGTSMACPHVSGIAALVVSQYGGPDFTNTALKDHILTGTRDIYDIPANSIYKDKLGSGATDAVLALARDNKIAPDKILTLKLEGISQDFASLSWKVPGDGDDSIPLNFDVYYSKFELSQANMAEAKVIRIKNTGTKGATAHYEVRGLQAITPYYFGVVALDRWNNPSEMSNTIKATTNSGPKALFDPAKPALNISINVTQNTTGSDNIKLLNQGEGILEWDALPRHKSAEPLSIRPKLQYPTMPGGGSVSPKGIISLDLPIQVLNNIQQDTFVEKGYVNQQVNLMIMGETDTKIPNSEATRFYVDEEEGFNLTKVDAFLKHDIATGPVILEIYQGENISDAQLLLAQEVTNTSPTGQYTGIDLLEQIFFEKGKYFWVVIHVPAGNLYPLGAGLELKPEDSKNCYISLNGGQTWKLFEDLYYDNRVVWAVFAMSKSLPIDQYITLSQDSGRIMSNHDTTLVASVDAGKMINGLYKANIVVNTNETGNPVIRIPLNITILGHKPKITSTLRVNVGNILIGTYKDVNVTFKNEGLGRFVYKSPNVVLGNPQFTYLSGTTQYIEAATSQVLSFRFSAATVGNNICQVTLVDENGNDYKFELFGAGMEPPVVKINPPVATYNNLAIGDSIKGQVTIKNTGKYPLDYYMPAFADGSNMESVPANIHKFGYSVKVDTTGASYVWNDIAASGKDITDMYSGNTRTNIYQKFPLAFLFPFFGKNENFVYITKYGFVSFDDHDYVHSAVPMQYKSIGNPDRYISAGGFPQQFADAGFGKIYYKQETDKFIVQYDNVPYWYGTQWVNDVEVPAAMTFQIVLHDNGNISMYYKANTLTKNTCKSNLVAIEDQTKADGLFINGLKARTFNGYTGGYSFKPGTAIKILNPGLGLYSNISKPYGTVMPNDSSSISYTIKTDSLNVLPYTENLVIITNDPYTNPSIHTAAFNIVRGGVSDIKIDSSDLKFGTLYKGTVKGITFQISNKGKANDSLVSAVFDNNFFTLTGSIPALLKPERTIPYSVSAKTQALGTFSDTLRLTTKNGQKFKISLSLQVIQGPVIALLNTNGTALSSITKFLNAGANTTTPFRIRNTGSVDLHVAPSNNDWETITETVSSPNTLGVMYRWKRSTEAGGPAYDWVEISETGTDITTVDPWFNKDFSPGIKMPFPFNFYGKNYDSIYIGNGLVTFTPNQNETGTAWGGRPIPDTSKPNNYIAPCWLFGGPDYVVLFPKSGIYYQAYDDRVIVEYRDFNSNFSMGEPVSFEVILYKNGNIKFQYLIPAGNTVTSNGTIGLENEDGTKGLMISEYQKVVGEISMAIGVYPTRSYTIPSGNTKDFTMLLNAKDLVEGSYADSVAFTNNDPDNLNLTLPTRLVVTGVPAIQNPEFIKFDTLFVNPKVPTASQAFEIKNTGTANFTLNSITQKLPADVVVEIFTLQNKIWSWTKLSNYTFPTTVPARSSLKLRATVAPTVPVFLKDTLVLNTSLTPATYTIPVAANIYSPPVMQVSMDTISYYAQTEAFTAAKTLKLANSGGFNLVYTADLQFLRANGQPQPMSNNTGQTKPATPGNIVVPMPVLISHAIQPVTSGEPETDNLAAYNRILAYDTAKVPVTRMGYNGARTFYAATGFNAPGDGFLLSHIQNWIAAGEWLNSKVKVMVLAGDENINNCKELLSETFNLTVTQPDNKGNLITHKLSKSLQINPNEKFFVVFAFEAGLTYPQGCVAKTEVVPDRFLFGAGDSWYDMANYAQFDALAWMMRAVEEKAGDVPWVVLSAGNSGTIAPTKEESVVMNFTTRTAPDAENYAYLVINSNDLVKPEKQIVLHLKKNKGPVYQLPENSMVVNENGTLEFQVSASDQEGDSFTFAVDSAYKFLEKVDYTNPDPKVKTIKFRYKPDYKSEGKHVFGFTGTDQFNYGSNTSVTVTVNNVNRAPVPVAKDTLKFKPYGNYKIVTPSDLFSDADNDMEILEAVSANPDVLSIFTSGSNILLMPLAPGKTSVTFLVIDKYGAKSTNKVQVLVSELVTGIKPLEADGLVVYPNPTRGEVNMYLPSDMKGKVTMTLYSTQGTAVRQQTFTISAAEKLSFDLSNLPAGIYFLKSSDNTSRKTVKIIKQ